MTTYVHDARATSNRQPHSGAQFVQIPVELLTLPSDELHVYMLLCNHAGGKDFCWPSDRSLGLVIGKSRDTVSKIMKRLEGRGLITRDDVAYTDENPTCRMIFTHCRVPTAPVRHPLPQRRGKPAAKRSSNPAAPVRQELDPEKKQHAGDGDVPPEMGSPPPAENTELRAAWDRLTPTEQDRISDVVRAENPGLRKWSTKALEPLCLEQLDKELGVPITLRYGT